MAEGKVTIMKLKVDLQCSKCYKKVEKLLCKFPQIRDQAFDEKQGIVTIKVACCDPEKLRDKLCCKGEGCIKSIEIVKPSKDDNKKAAAAAIAAASSAAAAASSAASSAATATSSAEAAASSASAASASAAAAATSAASAANRRPCCGRCSEGHAGGPCYLGFGRPLICYDAYYKWPVCDSYGECRPCYVSRCDQNYYDENSQGCAVM